MDFLGLTSRGIVNWWFTLNDSITLLTGLICALEFICNGKTGVKLEGSGIYVMYIHGGPAVAALYCGFITYLLLVVVMRGECESF